MAIPVKNNELLYANFLERPRVYNLAEAYWARTARRLAGAAGLGLQRFYNTRYAKGEKMYDGNPIFDAYFPERHKLLRILQYLPEPGDLPISGWLGEWPADAEGGSPVPPEKQGTPIPELTISLALTRDTGAAARRLLRLWVVEDCSVKEMEAALSAEIDG